jgi:hypothetical protein
MFTLNYGKNMSVPVISINNKPLFPCKERRARCLIANGRAVAYWQKGIFCIKLTGKESFQREPYSEIALGIDPGSKREGYTISTEKAVVLNVSTDTKDWIKKHVEVRRSLRRARRQRKTPYRKCRSNRLRNKVFLPPSTRARWNTKLQMIKFLLSIIPITIVNVEDIKAATKKGKVKWNRSFSPLEVGKTWFYSEVEKLGVKLILTQGSDTFSARNERGFNKSKKKLDFIWETHNVDSHILCELALGKQVQPYFGIWKVEFLEYHRRQLQKQNIGKGGKRIPYGSTVSMGMSRGSVVFYKNKICYLGGSSKRGISIHSIVSGERLTQCAKVSNVKVMCTSNRRVQFLPRLKPWVSLLNF